MRGGTAPRGFFRNGGSTDGPLSRRKSLRERFLAVARRAAEAGWTDAPGLFSMTPAEIELALTACAARERRRLERMDAAAWLAGRYAAVAWHAPGRYPARPVSLRPARMSDGEMKDALLAMVRRRGGSGADDERSENA